MTRSAAAGPQSGRPFRVRLVSHLPAMALDDAFDQRQPQADSFLACGHQGLEEAGAH